MNIITYALSCFLFCVSLPASADLISPQVEEAQHRLQANPNTYDRVDNFCKDKKPGASCTMPGTIFAGGGEGICQNYFNRNESTIEMSCIRQSEIRIDRDIPEWGASSPTDRFCKGKNAGNPCTVELSYQGRTEHPEGVCKEMTETQRYYRQGYHTNYRSVLSCEPPHEVEHTFTAVSWHEKLLP